MFDISWKVMKDILIKKMGILDFAVDSPRETLQQAFTNKIIDDDRCCGFVISWHMIMMVHLQRKMHQVRHLLK